MKGQKGFNFTPMFELISRDEYGIGLQFDKESNLFYVHFTEFDKEKWSVGMYKKILKDWSDILDLLKFQYGQSVVRTKAKAYDTKLKKFLNMFGFIEDGYIVKLENGEQVEVMQASV